MEPQDRAYHPLQEEIISLHLHVNELQHLFNRQQKLSEVLRDADDTFRLSFENISDAMFLMEDGVFIDCNQAALHMMRYASKNELRSFPLSAWSPQQQPDDRSPTEKTEELIATVLREGSIQFTWLQRRANGEIFPADVALSAISLHGKTVIQVIVRDLTEQRQLEEDLKRFFTLSLDMLCIAGFDGYFKKLNPAWGETLGYTLKELMAEPFIMFVHPDDREQTICVAEELTTGKTTVQFENRYRCSDGSYKWIEWKAAPVVEKQIIYAVARDITERKATEAALRERMVQEEIIHAQEASLRELSTPLIPLSEHVVVMPLIGTIDRGRAQLLMETLLEGIASYQAEIAILDITGVPVVDTQIASALVRTARAVRLLGAQVILTGIRPDVAQTLVQLGADLGDIITRRNLQSGIAYALTQTVAT